mgnify:CR=1 FL=1
MFAPIEIAGMVCPNNVFLAPLAGYTNYPFRKLCSSLGAGLTFTEMVSCKGLAYGSAETKKLLCCGEESPKAAQIFGNDPDIMRAACEGEDLAPFDLIDVNMGCPMPKIVRNGEGSALMENFPLAEKVIAACVKSGKRVSVKFRIGISEDRKIAAEFARLCAGAGACMITVHGRVREKIYAGAPDYAEIAAAKNAVSIPVIANGGVWSKKDAETMLSRTGADGVMIARAALYRPQVFTEFSGIAPAPMKDLFLAQLRETRALYGERFACVFMRKMAAFYVKGKAGATEAKRRLFQAQTTEEVESLAALIF